MNIIIDSSINSFNQEADAAIIRHPMVGVKHLIPLGVNFYAVISVPPGNILEFQADFYTREMTRQLAHKLLKDGWILEYAKMDVLQKHVIQVIEFDDIQLIQILEAYVNKRIAKLFNEYPTYEDIPPATKNAWELDKLINLQTLLQNKKALRPALLGIYKFIGKMPVEI